MNKEDAPVEPMDRTKFVRNRRAERPNRLVWVLLFAFMIAAIITAYLTFIFIRSVVATFKQPDSQPLVLQVKPTATKVPLDPKLITVPLQAEGPEPHAWDGKTRVTLLMMGLDYRDWENDYGPARTDTMILFTLDPETRTAGILSIPRDLWVNIPGFDYGKINTAHFLGDAYDVPGGGPGLAMQTVEEFLDIPIHFYAQVDFTAFERIIDELGGIEVYVPEAMSVDPIGPNNTVELASGMQTLSGPVALAYARARNTAGNDFDRAERQQQVILAIRDRVLSLNILPILIEKSPILYHQLSKGVHSNLTLEQVISIAWMAQQVPPENIRRGVIGFDQVRQTYSWDGQDILQPIPEEIRALRDDVLFAAAPVAPAAVEVGNPEELRREENARVSVLNGTFTPGLASQTTAYLLSFDINVVATDNAQDVYERTTIVDYSGSVYTTQYLVELLNIQPEQIVTSFDPNRIVDIVVYLGNDWVQNNNMP